MAAEASAAPVERILCCNVLDSEMTPRDAIFRHPLFGYEEALAWPPPHWREVLCWHCCHTCPSVRADGGPAAPVCLPNSYDRRREVFHVFGFFCSLQCAKAYLMEHCAFGSGDRTMLLHFLAVKHFGHTGGPVAPAPPRHRLRIFGGDLDIAAFRREHIFLGTTCSPPLISTPEVYERCEPAAEPPPLPRSGGRGAGAGPLTAAPGAAAAGPSLFGAFVRQKRSAAAALVSGGGGASGPAEAQQQQQQPVPGTLSVFMKKKVKP